MSNYSLSSPTSTKLALLLTAADAHTHGQSRLDCKEAQSCDSRQFPLSDDTWLARQLGAKAEQLLHLRVNGKWVYKLCNQAYMHTDVATIYNM